MEKSTDIGKLAGALAEAQAEFKPVFKESDNPYFSSKYADLATVISATQPALARHGLVVVQSPIVQLDQQKAGVVTMLAHSSGEWISQELILPATMRGKDNQPRFDAQSVGSAISYARRYAYQSVVGVAAEVDDDGNGASGREGSAQAAQSVADRKIAEYKQKQQSNGNETVVLKLMPTGLLSIEGMGLGILRVEVTPQEKAKIGLVEKGSSWFIQPGKAFDFEDICRRHKVGATFENSPIPVLQNSPSDTPTQGLSATDDGGGQATTPPIIKSAKRKSGTRVDATTKKKTDWALLEVDWNGEKHVCWHESCWQHIEMNVGRPAEFSTTPSFDGKRSSTIDMILSINGVPYMENEPVVQSESR